jgi:hypothetical protein
MTGNNNQIGQDRMTLETLHGKVWSEGELAEEFKGTAIIANTVVVVRKSDSQVGSLTFQNDPRFYFDFQPDPGFGDA